MNWQDKIKLPNDKDYNRFLNNITMKKLLLRLAPELHQKLLRSAIENDRSVNSEIIQAIKNYLK
jgi:predicted HicB family RNase H-like nuclease